MATKLNINIVKIKSNDLGKWEILSDTYINSTSKLKVRCLKHNHITFMSWNNIKQNKGCIECNKLYNKNRLSLDKITEEFLNEGYLLLTDIYINNSQKLEFICPNGHKHNISYNNWKSGRRCFLCNGKVRLSEQYVSDSLNNEGYILYGKYTNTLTPIKYICDRGHEHKIRFSDWLKGDRCPYCSNHSSIGLDFSLIKKSFVDEGYLLISNSCINAMSYLKYKCKKGHKGRVRWNNWQQGNRCKKCSNNISRFEKEIKDYIKKLNITFISNDRSTVFNSNTNKYLELDLYFPRLNKAIECNGVYWHSDIDTKNRDFIKITQCFKKNIDLLVITDYDWLYSNNKCKWKIKNFLNLIYL